MRDKVISIFCLVDDILQGINHEEDKRRRVSDSEVLTTALVSAMYFSGNHHHAIHFMKATNLIPKMLDKSRFSRRIHQVWQLLYEVFLTIGNYLKEFCCEMRYILDSFPVAVLRALKSCTLTASTPRPNPGNGTKEPADMV